MIKKVVDKRRRARCWMVIALAVVGMVGAQFLPMLQNAAFADIDSFRNNMLVRKTAAYNTLRKCATHSRDGSFGNVTRAKGNDIINFEWPGVNSGRQYDTPLGWSTTYKIWEFVLCGAEEVKASFNELGVDVSPKGAVEILCGIGYKQIKWSGGSIPESSCLVKNGNQVADSSGDEFYCGDGDGCYQPSAYLDRTIGTSPLLSTDAQKYVVDYIDWYFSCNPKRIDDPNSTYASNRKRQQIWNYDGSNNLKLQLWEYDDGDSCKVPNSVGDNNKSKYAIAFEATIAANERAAETQKRINQCNNFFGDVLARGPMNVQISLKYACGKGVENRDNVLYCSRNFGSTSTYANYTKDNDVNGVPYSLEQACSYGRDGTENVKCPDGQVDNPNSDTGCSPDNDPSATSPDEEETCEDASKSSLGFIACPVQGAVAEAVDTVYGWILDKFHYKRLNDVESSTQMKTAWENFRNLANIGFAVVM